MNEEQIELYLSEMNVLLKHNAKPAKISQDNELLIINYLCQNRETIGDAVLFISRYHGFSSISLSLRHALSLHIQGQKLHKKLVDKITVYALENHQLYCYLSNEQVEKLMKSYILNKKFVADKLASPLAELTLQDIFHITKALGLSRDSLFEMANSALEYEYKEWVKKTE